MADQIMAPDKDKEPCLQQSSKINHNKMWGIQRSVGLDVAMACWGLGTWLGVNGLYVQLPLLVEVLPEGWALPTSMALSVQLANVGLLLYALAHRLRPGGSDAPYIYILLAIGTAALVLNAFLYDQTVPVGNSDRSVAFLSLTFFAALVGCTSSVLFYPFLRHYREIYLVTYLVGEGLSGFLPSILALIQGVGGEPVCLPSDDNSTFYPHYPPPRFSTGTFLLILAALSCLSLISFAAVHKWSAFQSERAAPKAIHDEVDAPVVHKSLFARRWVVLFGLTAFLNAVNNGVLPSIQSFSCMPYGASAYHLAATLGAMANPAACLAGVWLKAPPGRILALLLLVASPPFAYILTTALMSPTPPLLHEPGGVALVVISWVAAIALISYARMWTYGAAREGGARAMRACGAFSQIGSAVGSLLLFVLINYTEIFVQSDPCAAAHT